MEQVIRTSQQIGAALRRHRKQLGLSQEQISHKTSLRQATISSLENGDAGTKLGTLFDVMTSLNLELIVRPRSKARTNLEDIF